MPRLSVILPCRNAAAWLPAAIRTIERQTFHDFEVIAIDDGSVDDTRAQLDDWSRRDVRVHVLHPGRVGLIGALQLGAAGARGELIGRMDADDLAHRRRFEMQIGLLDRDAALAACGTRIRYFPRASLKEGARGYERWINALTTSEEVERDLFVECPIAHPTLVVRRSVFERVGGYRDAGWAEDYDLVLRIWQAGGRLGNVPRVLLAWRDRPDRTSRTHRRYSRDAFRGCKMHFLLETKARGRDLVIAGAGPTGKAFSREAARRGARIVAFMDVDPRKVGQTIHDAPVVRPERIGDFAGAFGLAAVADAVAREEIRQSFRRAGWIEGRDFCAVA